MSDLIHPPLGATPRPAARSKGDQAAESAADGQDSTSGMTLKEILCRETREQARQLTRDLVKARLAMPGTEAYLDREEQLFDELIRTGWIASKARQMGADDSADDVQQRVLMRLMVDFREGRLYAIGRGYVETTVGFDVKTQWRRTVPGLLSEEAESSLAAREVLPDSELADLEQKLALAWARLEEKHRFVLSRRYPNLLPEDGDDIQAGDGQPPVSWTLEKIGEALCVSTATAHRYAKAAVESLLDGLREEGLDDFAARLGKELL